MGNFNFWYLQAPLFAVVTFLFGTTRYRLTKKNRIVNVGGKTDATLVAVSGLLSLVLQMSILAESFLGVMQVIFDHLLESDYGWAPVMMVLVMLASYAMFYIAFFYSGKLGEVAMKGLLRFLLKKKRGTAKSLKQIFMELLQRLEIVH